MFKKFFIFLFSLSLIFTHLHAAGGNGGDGGESKLKKLTSYDSAVKKINKANGRWVLVVCQVPCGPHSPDYR